MGDQGGSEQQPTAAAAAPSMDSVQTLKFPPLAVFDGPEEKFEDFEFKLKVAFECDVSERDECVKEFGGSG